jgi:carbon monoxide dehydrogenase subunit G
MQIENQFDVPLGLEQAWDTLLDVPAIANCMPGAQLLETQDDETYKGEVQVKLGPMLMSFRGTAQIVETDPASHTAKVKAQGRDTKGRGNASALVTFALESAGQATRVRLKTDLNLSGSVAQYGRSSGMIKDVADHLIGEFAKNLEKKLQTDRPESANTPAADDEDRGSRPAETERSSGATPISGLALFIHLIKRRLARIFGRA